MTRPLSIAFCSLLTASCGLFNPSVKTLDMALGDYLLIATPVACGGGDVRPGIGTMVTLSHEDRDWVARSRSSAAGNVLFRFHEVADSRVAGVAVAGTLTGSGQDQRPFAAAGARVSFGGGEFSTAPVVSAQTTPNALNTIAGNVTGPIEFRDDGRGPSTCTRAEMALRIPEPCELDPTVPCR